MASITIRDVPDQTRDELAARARLSGRSMQEFLRAHLVELAGRPDPDEFWRQVQARKRRLGTRLSVAEILQARDAERR